MFVIWEPEAVSHSLWPQFGSFSVNLLNRHLLSTSCLFSIFARPIFFSEGTLEFRFSMGGFRDCSYQLQVIHSVYSCASFCRCYHVWPFPHASIFVSQIVYVAFLADVRQAECGKFCFWDSSNSAIHKSSLLLSSPLLEVISHFLSCILQWSPSGNCESVSRFWMLGTGWDFLGPWVSSIKSHIALRDHVLETTSAYITPLL